MPKREPTHPTPSPPNTGVPFFCCNLALITLLTGRDLEHTRACNARREAKDATLSSSPKPA